MENLSHDDDVTNHMLREPLRSGHRAQPRRCRYPKTVLLLSLVVLAAVYFATTQYRAFVAPFSSDVSVTFQKQTLGRYFDSQMWKRAFRFSNRTKFWGVFRTYAFLSEGSLMRRTLSGVKTIVEKYSVFGEELAMRVVTSPENHDLLSNPKICLLWFPGGSYVFQSSLFQELAESLAMRGFSSFIPSYRHFPPHAFPVQFGDAVEALKWVYHNGARFCDVKSRLVVGGDGSGGALAAAVLLYLRDKSPEEFPEDLDVHFQVMVAPTHMFPFVSGSQLFESYKHYGRTGFYLDGEMYRTLQSLYLGGFAVTDPEDPMVSYIFPLLTKTYYFLPDALVITAQHSLTRDEGTTYAKVLDRFGVHVQNVTVPGVVGFTGDEVVQLIHDGIESHFSENVYIPA